MCLVQANISEISKILSQIPASLTVATCDKVPHFKIHQIDFVNVYTIHTSCFGCWKV